MSTSRILVSSGTDFESTVGYSRAVRVGPHVAVAGTTGPGTPGDIGAQTREALRRIEIALNEAGAALSDVIRTRIYVTDISRWREVAMVHAEVFGQIRPAATMVEVPALIVPELFGGDRSRRLLRDRRERAVRGGPVASDVDHSPNGQGAVQMREQHRLRIRCYS
jgi:enamine deaminase RidA (YjgF/YER057c/UK114 family)